jgi:predicted DNA-binding transcriptional regulator AlpA
VTIRRGMAAYSPETLADTPLSPTSSCVIGGNFPSNSSDVDCWKCRPIQGQSDAIPDSLQFLRVRDVCRLLRISKPTLWRLRRAQDFPDPTDLTGRVVAWRRSEVEAWLRARARGLQSSNPARRFRGKPPRSSWISPSAGQPKPRTPHRSYAPLVARDSRGSRAPMTNLHYRCLIKTSRRFWPEH